MLFEDQADEPSDVGQSRPDDGSRRPVGASFFEGDEMGILRGVII